MNPTADVRDLLAHADWLRRLAGHLVGRAGDPEDLVQQTWLAALRRPPAADRPARPWLAEVLRNFARKAHRDRRAREGREQTVAGDAGLGAAAGAPPSESLLEAAQLQRQLADLVLALDEPYRTTILMRFYQGIEPAEIARASGVPAGTVRWRVNEGIRRLRGSLDSAPQAGEWRRALLPFLGAAPAALPGLARRAADHEHEDQAGRRNHRRRCAGGRRLELVRSNGGTRSANAVGADPESLSGRTALASEGASPGPTIARHRRPGFRASTAEQQPAPWFDRRPRAHHHPGCWPLPGGLRPPPIPCPRNRLEPSTRTRSAEPYARSSRR